MAVHAVVNADIWTMESPDARASALLWKDDRVIAVGTDELIEREAAKHNCTPQDLQGKTLLPGFVDGHMHFIDVGVKAMRPNLAGTANLAAAQALVRAWLTTHPDGPVVAEGWDEADWADGRQPTLADVEAISSERPIVLRRVCGHIATGNSAAVALAKPHWPALVDEETGVLLEDASLYLNEAIPESAESLDAALQEACKIAHGLGVTALGDYVQAPYRDALLRAAKAGSLSVRVACSIYVQQLEDAIAEGFATGRTAPGPEGPSTWLQDGGLKIFLDGSLGGHTALLSQPYSDHCHTCGMANWTKEELRDLFSRAAGAGIQIHAHAIGDAAIDLGLDMYEEIVSGESPLKHRFEHYELPSPAALNRSAKLGIHACAQPNFVGVWSSKGGMYEQRLGARYVANNRFQDWLASGVSMSFGSDGMPFGPILGLKAAVDHPETSQRLSPSQAVWLYTNAAARANHLAGVGVLAAGCFADFVILDGSPDDWRIEATYSAGRRVYQAPLLAGAQIS